MERSRQHRIAPINRVVDDSSVVGTINSKRAEWSYDLIEQGLDLRAVIDIARGQVWGEDLSSLDINANVQLSPSAATLGAVLLEQPRARSKQLLSTSR